MHYVSTRADKAPSQSQQASLQQFSDILLGGLAPDGGLYLPEHYPQVTGAELNAWRTLSYADLAFEILKKFATDIPAADLKALTAKTYTKAVYKNARAGENAADITPLRVLEENLVKGGSTTLMLQALSNGPTLAFKDMAMQMIAPLTDAALAQNGETLTLVTATSGDTGAAAVRAFAGSERVRLVVFHPLGRVSPVQRLQMTTVEADNVLNVGIEGDFDDCQRIVKRLLGEESLKQNGLISSVNSINWGRLLGQVPYYLAAAAASGADKPEFVVPTGNFGDAFAGWAGRKIGGNIGHIHAAVNRNDALAQAINTGIYRRHQAVETASVSMDVQAPSNFERLVFEASGRQAEGTKGLFDTFNATGEVHISPDLLDALRAQVTASTITEAETAETIKYAWDRWQRVICPHTAVAVGAALKRNQGDPIIALSTAHPAKFPDFVGKALGFTPEVPEAIARLHGQKETIRELKNDEFAALELVKSFAH